MTNHSTRTFRLAEIELEARRMRAEAVRGFFARLGGWLRKPRGGAVPMHGRTA